MGAVNLMPWGVDTRFKREGDDLQPRGEDRGSKQTDTVSELYTDPGRQRSGPFEMYHDNSRSEGKSALVELGTERR